MALALVQSARLLLVDRWLQGARHAWVAGRPAEAEQLALRGLRFDRQMASSGRSWLALACDSETTMARSQQRSSASARSTAEDIYITAAIERRRGRHEQAIEELQALHETLPGLLRPRVLLAETYAEAGRYDEARAMLLEVVGMRSKLPSADERDLRARAAELLRTLPPP